MEPDELLAHVDWVRGLARGLVLDPNRADDLTQKTCVVALTRPPADRRNPRGWLARVLRNLIYQEVRSEDRRRAREKAVARPDEGWSERSEAERRASCHRLVELVTELEEPFRNTVLQRYFEDLSPKDIAAREGVPEATVRSRLRRGLERLRRRLDRQHEGERVAWIAGLARLERGALSPAAPATAQTDPAGLWPKIGIGFGAAAVLVAGLALIGPGSLPGTRKTEQSRLSPEAAEALDRLRRDAGTWDCTWEYLDEDGNVIDEARGTESFVFHGENVLELTSEVPSRGLRSRGYELYDPVRGTLVLVDVALDGEGWIFLRDRATGQLVSLPRTLPDGSTHTLRFTVLLEDDDYREVLLESSVDDGATWRMESMQLKRRRT